ncbi:MAG: DUF3333 domain-containing protein [Betaproteobacteria bacterium AqS2]|uniref:DUF3333 domain-containing protein n=1 Tax=Candidatus Amphirhobacter heronislandensis TaxID=1732024 RepID=A0A930UGT3_9GAMM|nr:DUF3333 domain-containing protein [Betaproteobacteria bacterium AqS2]
MTEAVRPALARRYRQERLLVLAGKASIVIALLFLAGLLGNVAVNGWRALLRAEIQLPVHFDPAVIGAAGEHDALAYARLVKQAARADLAPDAGRKARKEAQQLLSFGAALQLRDAVAADPALVGATKEVWLPAASAAELHLKAFEALPGAAGRGLNLSERQATLLDRLHEEGRTALRFNGRFFTAGDSRDPEAAGIGGALMGSLLTLIVTLIATFPVGVGAAVYLELLAPRSRVFDFIEVNINNLAAVPSVIMGLLGLAVLIGVFGVSRSTPLVGGMVLGFLTLPTIIIAARAALKAVPDSLLHAALSLGATRLQGIVHQVLPAAMPGIMTGTIIGMAGALGETAPLLMVGMVAFVVAVPTGFGDVATALPVQIFLWADSPERGYVEKTALAICVLIAFLLAMNAAAIWLRRRFEKLL